MSEDLETRIRSVGADGHVSADDVTYLRRTIFADGIVTREELKALFALGEKAPSGDPEWTDYFAEAAADFYLREEEPHGYLTEHEFAEIAEFVQRDGARASALELKLLVALMEKAVATPDDMAAFAADQFRRRFGALKGGARISAEDVSLIRRFLYAAGGAGATAVTRLEAELLFDLNDLSAGADNDPAWLDLFVKGVAAHLMAHVGYKPLPRNEALRLHDWVKDQSINPGGFFNRMISGGISAIRDSYRPTKSVSARKNADDEIAAAIAEQVTALEADWIADRIGRNGRMDEAERAILEFMKTLGASLPPKLSALIEKAA